MSHVPAALEVDWYTPLRARDVGADAELMLSAHQREIVRRLIEVVDQERVVLAPPAVMKAPVTVNGNWPRRYGYSLMPTSLGSRYGGLKPVDRSCG